MTKFPPKELPAHAVFRVTGKETVEGVGNLLLKYLIECFKGYGCEDHYKNIEISGLLLHQKHAGEIDRALSWGVIGQEVTKPGTTTIVDIDYLHFDNKAVEALLKGAKTYKIKKEIGDRLLDQESYWEPLWVYEHLDSFEPAFAKGLTIELKESLKQAWSTRPKMALEIIPDQEMITEGVELA